jgi:hypothetical protein
MTSLAQTRPETYVSGRTPHLSATMLFGGALILGLALRFVTAGEAATSNGLLSGAPVDGVVIGAPAAAPALPDEPAAWLHVASGGHTTLLAGTAAGDPAPLRPSAYPLGSSIGLTVHLPTTAETTVQVATARLEAEGQLAAASRLELPVTPAEDGRATLDTTVDTLLAERAPGIYRVTVRWEGAVIGRQDVALGMAQPSGVAIFDEPRQVIFTAGEHTGVQFDAQGQVAGRQPSSLGASSGAPAVAYARFNGSPHALITAGVWAGYWMPLGEGVELR